MGLHEPVSDWTTDFDHTDDEWAADPYPIWEELRQTCPVAHTDRYGGAWLVSRVRQLPDPRVTPTPTQSPGPDPGQATEDPYREHQSDEEVNVGQDAQVSGLRPAHRQRLRTARPTQEGVDHGERARVGGP